MNNFQFRNLLKCNIILLAVQALAIPLLIAAAIAYFCVNGSSDNAEDMRRNLINVMIYSVIDIVFVYIISLVFSLVIYFKKQPELYKDKVLYQQFIWGLIPVAQQLTWISSIKMLKRKNNDDPRGMLNSF